MDEQEYTFIPGKKYIVCTCVVLLLLGITELVASVFTTIDSGGYYIGGWYVGMVTIPTALRGFYLQNSKSLNWLGLMCFLSFIAAIVGATLLSGYYILLNSLNACASYNGSTSDSCGYDSVYTCYGDSDYYHYAALCEADYVNDNDFDDTANQCSCVEEKDYDDDSHCYSFTGIKECSKLLNEIPKSLHASYIVAVFIVILSVFLLILTCTSLRSPSYLASEEELAIARATVSQPTNAARTAPQQASAVVLHPRDVIMVSVNTNNNTTATSRVPATTTTSVSSSTVSNTASLSTSTAGANAVRNPIVCGSSGTTAQSNDSI